MAANASAKALNSLNSSATCGFFVDPNVDIKTNIGDTIKTETTGSIYFYFKCNPSGKHFGFINDDTLNTAGIAPGYTSDFDLTEHFNVTATNADNRYFNVYGNIKSFVDFIYTNKIYPPLSIHDKFFFSGIVFDLVKQDITSGHVTFVSKGKVGKTTWDFPGTADFLGNHKIRITINGFTFTVNYLTGKVTIP